MIRQSFDAKYVLCASIPVQIQARQLWLPTSTVCRTSTITSTYPHVDMSSHQLYLQELPADQCLHLARVLVDVNGRSPVQ